MTNGENGLRPEDKNINLRYREALSALKVLGFDKGNLNFANFPF